MEPLGRRRQDFHSRQRALLEEGVRVGLGHFQNQMLRRDSRRAGPFAFCGSGSWASGLLFWGLGGLGLRGLGP